MTGDKTTRLVCALGIVAISIFQLGFIHETWTHYWLSRDGMLTTAIVTAERSHGYLKYEYIVNENRYSDTSHRNWNDEQCSSAGIGGRVPIHYSLSHPWLSSLEEPGILRPSVMPFLLLLIMELAMIISIVNPRSKWVIPAGEHDSGPESWSNQKD